MKVYHGSYTAIEHIDFSFCRRRRDFGKGFYVTKICSQSAYWAARKGEDNDTDGVVTEFEFDEYAFEDAELKTLRFDGYTEEWLDFVVKNRLNKTETQAHDYDMIEGPVADDDIATRVYAYIKGEISKENFLSDLSRRTPTLQICFCTRRSLQALEPEKGYAGLKPVHIDNEVVQALMRDYGLSEAEAIDRYYPSKTFALLSDENTGLYLKPWQEIYEMLKKEWQM